MRKLKLPTRKHAKPSSTLQISDSDNNDNANLDMTAKTNTSLNTPIEQTRWNGWGNVNINKKVSPHGAKLIKSHIGKTKKLKSVSLQQVLKTVPKSRLPAAIVSSKQKCYG